MSFKSVSNQVSSVPQFLEQLSLCHDVVLKTVQNVSATDVIVDYL